MKLEVHLKIDSRDNNKNHEQSHDYRNRTPVEEVADTMIPECKEYQGLTDEHSKDETKNVQHGHRWKAYQRMLTTHMVS